MNEKQSLNGFTYGEWKWIFTSDKKQADKLARKKGWI
jgi:hypothetical protein